MFLIPNQVLPESYQESKEIQQELLTEARVPYVLDLEHWNLSHFFYYKVVKSDFSENEGSMFF